MQTLENRERALLVGGLVHQQLFPGSRQRFPPLADERVVQNPEHPRAKGAFVRQRRAGPPRACDGLGHEVLRIGLVLRQTPGHAVQRTEDRQNLGSKASFEMATMPAPRRATRRNGSSYRVHPTVSGNCRNSRQFKGPEPFRGRRVLGAESGRQIMPSPRSRGRDAHGPPSGRCRRGRVRAQVEEMSRGGKRWPCIGESRVWWSVSC